MVLSSAGYRQKFKAIARFVDWKLPKRLKPSDKAKISRYHNRIGKALAKGYKPTKCKNDGRIEAAHRAQGIRGLPGMKVALIKPVGAGFRSKVNRDGSISATNRENGISKVTIEATFFDADEVEKGDAEEEAARLIKAARSALGHKPQRCAVAYWGGENAWADPSFLADLLIVSFNQYANSRGFPADGVSFYWVKQTKRIAQIQQGLRDARTKASQHRADRRKRSDV